jgi:hypothetical protein
MVDDAYNWQKDNPSEKGETHIHPRFRQVRVIQWVEGHNVIICDCGYFHQIGLPCGHLFHVKGNISLTDCDIRWYKSCNYHFGRIPRFSQQVSQIINRIKVVGVPCVASPPTIVSAVYINCTDSFFFNWVMKAQSPVMMDESFPVRLEEDSEEKNYYNLANESSPVMGEYSSLFISQQSTTEYAAAIQSATTPQSTNNPYRFHLEAYKHLIIFSKSDPRASRFLRSLLNYNLQKMVEFTTEKGLVETPLAEIPTTNAFSHHPTAVITSSHCLTSRKRKCKILKRAGEYCKKKNIPQDPPKKRVA